MSYDLTSRRFSERADADFRASVAADVNPRPNGTAVSQPQLRDASEDARLLGFIKRLDAAPFEVTDWEAKFISDLMERERWALARKRPFSLSEGQREVIEKLRQSYAHRMPLEKSEIGNRKFEVPPAEPGTCAFIIRNDERQLVRCGNPAECTTNKGMQICADHKQARDVWRKRQKERAQRL